MGKRLDGGVQSVDRAMLVLETLGECQEGQCLTALSRQTGLSLTTAHRLLTTLQQRRFVQFSPSEKVWRVGLRAFSVGSAILRDSCFISRAQPFLKLLRDRTGETANLGIVDNREMIKVCRLESRTTQKAGSPIGSRIPMTRSGIGKAVLYTYTPREIESVYRADIMNTLPSDGIVLEQSLLPELREARTRGYAIDDQSSKSGLCCVAAPIVGRQSDVVCAISISGSTARITPERIPMLGRLVADVAADFASSIERHDHHRVDAIVRN